MTEQVVVNAPFAQIHLHSGEEMVLALLQRCLDIHGVIFFRVSWQSTGSGYCNSRGLRNVFAETV
jgi:hypothetical protein